MVVLGKFNSVYIKSADTQGVDYDSRSTLFSRSLGRWS